MKTVCGLAKKCFLAVLAGCIILGSSGCNKAVVEEEVLGPVFFPPPPNQPKLQFLTSFKGGEKFDIEKPGFLETFVLGDAEIKVGTIGQPYGVAIHEGKIYVCDVGHANIKVMDLVNNKFTIFPSGRSLTRPVNMFIEPDGTKYVADSTGGAIVVFNADDKLTSYLGNKLGIRPIDVYVRDGRVYLTDMNSNQVLVLDKRSGELIERIGKPLADRANWQPDEFSMITDLTLDQEGNIYVGDKLKGRLTTFGSNGAFLRSYGQPGSTPASLVRVKGIAVDRESRVWVVDAGPAQAVKVFREDGRLLMLFGLLGTEPGQMYMPADVIIDYDNVDLFKDYVVKGAKLDFIVLVTNQYGDQMVSVYGFGNFPEKYSQPFVGDESDKSQVEKTNESKEPTSGE
ncbi:MAG: hypothetical protein DRP66_01550 [Planctomycetota bacterium]|nr:MAG: hypothetical protein DRP66_01550 [Planctomycetota bacterium]